MINHTAAPITSDMLRDLCKKLGLSEENRTAMADEVSELQKQMDQKCDFKYTPLSVGPNEIQLRRAPVFAAVVEATTKTFSHYFVYVGWGGKGADGYGLQYYSKSGDMNRAQLDVDEILGMEAFSAAMDKLKPPSTGEGARAALEQLKGQRFLTLEKFYEAYMGIRLKAESEKPGAKPDLDKLKIAIHNEIETIKVKLLPKTRWEIWFKPTTGMNAKQITLPEKDIGIAGGSKDLGEVPIEELTSGNTIRCEKINVRYLAGVDPAELLRVKQEELFARMLGDMYSNRDGTGVPIPFGPNDPEFKSISPELLKAVTEARPTYNLTSPFPKNTASCATGGKDVIMNAMGDEGEAPPAPSNYLFGYLNEMEPRWDPLKGKKEPVKERLPNPDIDTSSLRNGPINIEGLQRYLENRPVKLGKEQEWDGAQREIDKARLGQSRL